MDVSIGKFESQALVHVFYMIFFTAGIGWGNFEKHGS